MQICTSVGFIPLSSVNKYGWLLAHQLEGSHQYKCIFNWVQLIISNSTIAVAIFVCVYSLLSLNFWHMRTYDKTNAYNSIENTLTVV